MALPGISKLPVIDRDEARYAVASVQMAQTGDMVNIRFQDEARNKKPAASYWAQAVMINLFSKDKNERKIWAQRLPSVFGALIAVLACYWAGIPMIGRRAAFIGSALFAVSGLLVFEAHMAKTDAMLCACAALVLVSFAHLRQGGGRGFALLFWIALGCAVMIKGPVVPALAILTLLSLWIWERGSKDGPDETQQKSWIRKLGFWPGPLIFLLIILPWTLLIWQATDGQFFKEALGKDFGGKLVGAQEKHGGMPGYYLATLPLTFWPASLLLLPGLAFAVRAVRGNKQSQNPVVRAMRLAICFALPYWAVIELVPTKLPNYLLPIFPALSLMAGAAAVALLSVKDFKWARVLSALIFIAAGLGVITGALLAESVYGPAALWPYILGAAGVIIIFITGGALIYAKTRLALSSAFIAALVISPALYQFLMPSLSDLRLADRVAAEFEANDITLPRRGGPLVAAVNFTEPSLVYALGSEIVLGSKINVDNSLSPGSIIILDVARQDAQDFIKRFEGAELCKEEFAKFDGLNYSRGDPVTLQLSQVTICPPTEILEASEGTPEL